MNRTPLGSAAAPPDAPGEYRPPDATARAFLAGYAGTLLVPLLGVIALLTGWTLTAAGGWPTAVAAVTASAAGNAAWLHRRAWSPALVHLVSWVAPAALVTPPAALGWLSADGLVLWAPLTTVLAVCLALVHQPLPLPARRCGGGRPARDDDAHPGWDSWPAGTALIRPR